MAKMKDLERSLVENLSNPEDVSDIDNERDEKIEARKAYIREQVQTKCTYGKHHLALEGVDEGDGLYQYVCIFCKKVAVAEDMKKSTIILHLNRRRVE